MIPKSCDTLTAQATAYRSTWLLFLGFFSNYVAQHFGSRHCIYSLTLSFTSTS